MSDRDYRTTFRVLLSPRMYQAAKSAQPDTLREIDVRDGFDHRVGHLSPRRMTAESSNAPFLKRLGAFASHRGSWGGRRHDQGFRERLINNRPNDVKESRYGKTLNERSQS